MLRFIIDLEHFKSINLFPEMLDSRDFKENVVKSLHLYRL